MFQVQHGPIEECSDAPSHGVKEEAVARNGEDGDQLYCEQQSVPVFVQEADGKPLLCKIDASKKQSGCSKEHEVVLGGQVARPVNYGIDTPERQSINRGDAYHQYT